ncbi:N-acetylmuramoyl-L-alanine amidase CwlD [Virgibacillus phasianinus]|uniref:N-acetylmuramoyl-L-alanine amidase CwlD n=1 Tax=Virgibacillus phasianinus TaxID=2017483 RepID=A0A220U0T3_9BACI|nr:N-acetylmuramoyl-L-alanine amidase CwlD [Virgibacillus phasianinus]ASK61582.1 N-acetylmuramoyl-L-alanine amidase CwlD [Virgibacillus phasianinus]
MKRLGNITIWCFGFVLLIVLIRQPIGGPVSTWSSWSLPLAGKTVVLDPGHGGPDGGAVGKDQTLEKGITLKVAKMLQSYLQQTGATVYLTRERDMDLADADTKGLARRKAEDIRNRLKMIENKQADLFISIHLNALPSTKWSGAQTFYYPKSDKSEHLAKMIQAEIIRNLENTDRTALPLTGMYLLKHAKAPGALVEIGFLSNVQERELLKKKDYQEKMAASIYEGILRYATEDIPKDEKKK